MSDRQINAVVPFGLPAGRPALVEVEAGGRKSTSLSADVQPALPELCAVAGGSGLQAAALNQDGTLNSPQNPALQGSVISLFGTGGGALDPPPADGQLGPVPPRKVTLPVGVSFAGTFAEVLFAGSAPGLVAGVIQVNVRVPNLSPRLNVDAVAVSLGVGTRGSQSVNVAVR